MIDTFLFASGIGLAFMAGFSPFNSPWLLYKIVALLVYILAGATAMKQTGKRQWPAYMAATVAVSYMVFAATQKVPWPL